MAIDPQDDYDRDILNIIPERYDSDADSRQARAGHRLRTYVTLGAAVVAVGGIVAIGLHFMGGRSGGNSSVPVVQADQRPLKVRPDDRGGMQVPNQDKLVYERMEPGEGDGKIERLLPPPEVPQVPVPNQGGASAPAVPAGTEVLRPGTPAAQPAPVREEAPSETPVAPSVTPPPASASGYVPTQNRDAAWQPPQPKAAPPAKVASAPVTAPSPAPVPVQPPAAQPPAAAAVKAPASGDYLIQLGALRSSADAEKEWSRIQRANHDLLSTLKSDVVRVDLGEKGTFWRLRAGPLSEQAARQLCTDLKSRNQGCIIARK